MDESFNGKRPIRRQDSSAWFITLCFKRVAATLEMLKPIGCAGKEGKRLNIDEGIRIIVQARQISNPFFLQSKRVMQKSLIQMPPHGSRLHGRYLRGTRPIGGIGESCCVGFEGQCDHPDGDYKQQTRTITFAFFKEASTAETPDCSAVDFEEPWKIAYSL